MICTKYHSLPRFVCVKKTMVNQVNMFIFNSKTCPTYFIRFIPLKVKYTRHISSLKHIYLSSKGYRRQCMYTIKLKL